MLSENEQEMLDKLTAFMRDAKANPPQPGEDRLAQLQGIVGITDEERARWPKPDPEETECNVWWNLPPM